MKNIALSAAIAGTALALSAPVLADHHMENGEGHAMKAEVVEKNARGQAMKVMIDGKTYDVCTAKDQDGCINPRAAGLKWGNRALDYWPGQPASSMKK